MASAARANLVAVCQLMCNSDKAKNFCESKALITKAANLGAKVVFLPEASDYLSENSQRAVDLAEPADGPTVKSYRGLAVSLGVWLSIGLHIKSEDPSESSRIFNRHLLIDSDGNIVEHYDKLHLYDVSVEGLAPILESSWTIPGTKLVPPASSPVGNIGLGICYDLRFPEFSLCLAKQGAHILTYPSAFMQKTGLAHWEALLRARAIETQCYVIAAAQTGQPFANRTLYGHSMVVDPWGQVVASCHEGVDVCLANIDIDYLESVRKQMPVWSQRRTDIYKDVLPNTT